MFDHNFVEPPNQNELPLPLWAKPCFETFNRLFGDEVWREGRDAIKDLNFDAKLAGHAYIQEGMILRAFQIYKLYRELGYKSFQDYCLKEVGKAVWRCKQLIDAAMAGWHLLCQGFEELPNCVAQATSLLNHARKKGVDGDIKADWQKCIDGAVAEKKAITADFIESVLDPDSHKKTKQVKLPFEVWQAFKKKADREGISVQEYLEKLSKEEESEPQEEELTPEEEASTENQGQDQHNTDNDARATSAVQTDYEKRGFPSDRKIPRISQFTRLPEDPIPY